jgi:hypothetical protein
MNLNTVCCGRSIDSNHLGSTFVLDTRFFAAIIVQLLTGVDLSCDYNTSILTTYIQSIWPTFLSAKEWAFIEVFGLNKKLLHLEERIVYLEKVIGELNERSTDSTTQNYYCFASQMDLSDIMDLATAKLQSLREMSQEANKVLCSLSEEPKITMLLNNITGVRICRGNCVYSYNMRCNFNVWVGKSSTTRSKKRHFSDFFSSSTSTSTTTNSRDTIRLRRNSPTILDNTVQESSHIEDSITTFNNKDVDSERIVKSLSLLKCLQPDQYTRLIKDILQDSKSVTLIAEALRNELVYFMDTFDTKESTSLKNLINVDNDTLINILYRFRDSLSSICPLLMTSLVTMMTSDTEMMKLDKHFGDKKYEVLLGQYVMDNNQSSILSQEAARVAAKADVRSISASAIIGQLIMTFSSGLIRTPVVSFLNQFYYIVGGLTQKGFDVMSKLGICSSLTSIRSSVATALDAEIEATRKILLADRNDNDKIGLIMGDNYNYKMWHSLMKPNETFSHVVPSFTLLYKGLHYNSEYYRNHDTKTSTRIKAMPDISYDSIYSLASLMQEGVLDVSSSLQNIRDDSFSSLTKFTTLPSVSARSSKADDMLSKYFVGVGIGILGLDAKEGIVCMDPEPLSRLMEDVMVLGGGASSPFANFIVPPAPFHMQEHLLKSLFFDFSAFTILLAPYFRFMNYRPNTFNNMVGALLNKVESRYKYTFVNSSGQPKVYGEVINEDMYRVFTALSHVMKETLLRKDIIFQNKHNEEIFNLLKLTIVSEGTTNRRKLKLPTPLAHDEYMSMKKTKHFMEGLYLCYKLNHQALEFKYIHSMSPLVHYLFSIFNNQLQLAVGPFLEMVQGNSQGFFSNFPSMLTTICWNEHPNLLKAYTFNLLLLCHWDKRRPDIMKLLASVCKWWNDAYIEHKNSIMSRVIKRLYPANVTFSHLRIASVLFQWSWRLISVFSNITHTAPISNSVGDSDNEEFLNDNGEVSFTIISGGSNSSNSDSNGNSISSSTSTNTTNTSSSNNNTIGYWLYKFLPSILRKKPQQHGDTSTSKAHHRSEPLRQALYWNNNNGDSLKDLSPFLFKLFEDANKIDPAFISNEDANVINQFRPLQRSRDFIPEYLKKFDEYRMEAISEDNKTRANLSKTTLRLILESSTLKDTLKPLRSRLKYRAVCYSCPANMRIVFSSTFRNHNMILRSEHKESYVDCIENAIVNILHNNRKLQESEYVEYTHKLCIGTSDDEPQIIFDTNIDVHQPDKLTLYNQSIEHLQEFTESFWKSLNVKNTEEDEEKNTSE